jgi:antitoxin VapB
MRKTRCPNRNSPCVPAKRDLVHALAKCTGQPINKLVERALEHYDQELQQKSNRHLLDAVWELAAGGRKDVPADTTSAHDDLYDENGLPK